MILIPQTVDLEKNEHEGIGRYLYLSKNLLAKLGMLMKRPLCLFPIEYMLSTCLLLEHSLYCPS